MAAAGGLNPPLRGNPPLEAMRRRRRLREFDGSDDDEDNEDEDDGGGGGYAPPARRRAGSRRAARRAAAGRDAVAAAGPDNDGGGNPLADVSDEDDDVTFLPGPVPVFRLKKGKASGGDGNLGKRKKCCDYDSCSDEDSEDEGPVNVDPLLHRADAFAEPSAELWASYPRRRSGGEDDDEEDVDHDADEGSVHIPISWLRTGLRLSECGNGLTVRAPSDDEWERDRRGGGRRGTQHLATRDGPLKGARGLFPYNCKGVSVLLSTVTALIYSGASIRGGTDVACDLDRVPFDELTPEQRRREFDPRLVDALSSLIFLAARAGSRRCEERLAVYDRHWAHRVKTIGRYNIPPEEEDDYATKRLALQRRAQVCQVCWWETNPTDGATIYPEGRDPSDVRFRTSFTPISDLRSYVKTHLRSFKEPGGCALLLETILRCHGPLMAMPPASLLKCRCSESLQHLERSGKDKSFMMPMPEEHNCVTTDLLSLLLTGEIRSTYEGWSADVFGIGLLRAEEKGAPSVCARLLRPIKPIWICLGDLGYSTLFLDTKGLVGSADLLEDPGRALRLAHWNCWKGERTGFRVITSMHGEKPYRHLPRQQPVLIDNISDSEEHEGRRTVTDSIVERLHLEQKRDAPMPWRSGGDGGGMLFGVADATNPNLKPITDQELLSVSSHPEDEKYYPGQFRRWRFRFSGAPNNAMALNSLGGGGGVEWIPFYRLHSRQRLVVEMKLAPRICGVVRSRWPLATVRDFIPVGKFPLV